MGDRSCRPCLLASPELELPGTFCLRDHEHVRLAKEKSPDDSVLLGLAGGGGQF